jgi:hypothetical protein
LIQLHGPQRASRQPNGPIAPARRAALYSVEYNDNRKYRSQKGVRGIVKIRSVKLKAFHVGADGSNVGVEFID